MTQVAAASILVLTVGLSLGRPRLGRVSVDHAAAGTLGALLCIVFGLVPLGSLGSYLLIIAPAIVTIVCLMAITAVAEQSGLFDYLARRIAHAAGGNARRLFVAIFVLGSITGTVFTNDAAVLIFTPLVFRLVEEIGGDEWTQSNKLPFYFAVLYVANVAGALVISNPINLIVAQIVGISFVDYARWMIFPALVSIVASFVGVRLFFRRAIPHRFTVRPLQPVPRRRRSAMIACATVLGLTLAALFSGEMTGVPIWVVALGAAAALLALHGPINPHSSYQAVAKGIGWDVLIFVVGMFLIVRGVHAQFWSDDLAAALTAVVRDGQEGLIYGVSFGTGAFSAFFNNHPTAGLVALTLRGLDVPESQTMFLAFAALIGGDLGPKMLPIGSLAALMWFRLLRQRGVHVSYWLYIKVGVPVTLIAMGLAVLALHAEIVVNRLDW